MEQEIFHIPFSFLDSTYKWFKNNVLGFLNEFHFNHLTQILLTSRAPSSLNIEMAPETSTIFELQWLLRETVILKPASGMSKPNTAKNVIRSSQKYGE